MSKSFSSIAYDSNNLMIVDGLNLAFRWKSINQFDFASEYLATINSLRNSYNAKYVVVAADKGSSSYRKALYPEYKDNRKESFSTQTAEEKENFRLFFEGFEEALNHVADNSNYPVLRFKGTEADDIAAYLTIKYRKLLREIWLISTDKDWDLLVSEVVSRFSYVTRKETRFNNWNDIHQGYNIEDYISIKCLVGDAKDNVKGVEGIGSKRASDLIQKYGTAIDLAESLPLPGKQQYIANLNKSKDLIYLNYKLLDIETYCTDAIGTDNIKIIDSIMENYITTD